MNLGRVFHARCVGSTLIVSPSGSVGSLQGAAIRADLDRLLEQIDSHSIRNVIFDLEQVEYFGSVMLTAMHAIWKRVRQQDGKVVLCRVSEVGRDVLGVARFDSLWPIYDSPIDAVQAVSPTVES